MNISLTKIRNKALALREQNCEKYPTEYFPTLEELVLAKFFRDPVSLDTSADGIQTFYTPRGDFYRITDLIKNETKYYKEYKDRISCRTNVY